MAIRFDGEFTVATSRAEAFAILSDMQKFVPLLPTYKSHEIKEDGSAEVKVRVGVGKIRGTGTINLELKQCRPPDHASYLGKGKVMGSVFNLLAEFELADAGAGETRVQWSGELIMFGKLVSMAGGMIKPIANKDIARMIEAIRLALSGEEEAVPQLADTAGKPAGTGWLGKLRALMKKLADIVRGFLRKQQ